MIQAKDWMTKTVVTITKEKTVQEAASIMKEHNFGDLIVVENNTPIGIITERDISQKLVSENKNAGETPVEAIMTANIISAQETDTIQAISKRMNLAKIKKMPIMSNGNIVGIITTTDLNRVITNLQKDLLSIGENIGNE